MFKLHRIIRLTSRSSIDSLIVRMSHRCNRYGQITLFYLLSVLEYNINLHKSLKYLLSCHHVRHIMWLHFGCFLYLYILSNFYVLGSGLSITQAFVTGLGVPVVSLSDNSAFTFDPSLCTW